MNSSKIYSVAIIGGGSAGVMAALRCVLNNDDCLLFTGSPRDRKRSRALWVRKIENMPAHFKYQKGIEEPNQETLDWINASKFAANLKLMKNVGVTDIKKNAEGVFEITDHKNTIHFARYVILCTGVMDVQPLIQGEISPVLPFANLQSIDYCLRCDGHHVHEKNTAVIGHGIAAAWVAIMLTERYQIPSINILLNGKGSEFNDEVNELIKLYGIIVHPAPIKRVLGNPEQGQLDGFELTDGGRVESEMAFVSLGMIVYNELAKKLQANLDSRGFVIADGQGATSVQGLYVAGDLMAGTKKQVYTAWDTAVNAADAINQKLRVARREELKWRVKK